MSLGKSRRERRIDELLERLKGADILIVTELSRLGRSTGQVINLIDELINRCVRIIIIKENLSLNKSQDDIQSVTMIIRDQLTELRATDLRLTPLKPPDFSTRGWA